MNMGLDLASELHWLAFRKRVCHVKSWKQTTGSAFPEASKPAHIYVLESMDSHGTESKMHMSRRHSSCCDVDRRALPSQDEPTPSNSKQFSEKSPESRRPSQRGFRISVLDAETQAMQLCHT